MSTDKWDQFFDLLKEIVNAGEPWADKRDEVILNARKHGALTELGEFVAWLDDEF